ncbi:lysozyme inhibitor LprI family protein [Puniceibacterium sp. IMCC21224]|uniref:lysozyme inhibitor LprI family protein n=1 Tax=Puniceibacterium sp. IMCC21224 TaxID=1618204 RepID=UPI000A584A24|nr:lysozyme inhibitor LprI family protein [Puniceibacterium sp. IMCC21224]
MSAASAVGALFGVSASAQDVNCASPTTQYEMTACASIEYEAADADLNAAYKRAMAHAKVMDQGLAADEVTGAVILRDAQRAWIPFRDKACEAESLKARGGSMQSQLFYLCLTRQTRNRTVDLQYFAETY